MGNCLVAQSGGPSSVINATIAGIVKANQLNRVYDIVYGGLHGIEGVLDELLVDLTEMSTEENRILRQTPASALGSCRYKLKRDNIEAFERLFAILEKYDIDTMFYTGGNDSMDTVYALSEYAEKNGITDRRFVGCPKTVDNDLVVTDHCPGYGSAAKFINITANATWLDYNVYTREEVFVMETMGRDAGWLAASACVSGKVDILLLPEHSFDKEAFLALVKEKVSATKKCFIVVSEGVRYPDGTYLAAGEAKNDGFGHAILGGAGQALRSLILENKAASRVKVQDLSTAQRCAVQCQSLVDVEESFNLGMSAHMHSMDPSFTGYMVALKREAGSEYEIKYVVVKASEVANKVKNFPEEWILPNMAGITQEGIDYIKPLIFGEPDLRYNNGVVAYVTPYYKR